MTLYEVVDSGNGDVLGILDTDDDASDEAILENLVESGFLDGEIDDYSLDYNYDFSDGALTVLNANGEPVLSLETDDDEGEENDDSD